MILDIYLVGFCVALLYCVQIFKDDRGRIDRSDFFHSLLISTMSWITVLALWIGGNINNNKSGQL